MPGGDVVDGQLGSVFAAILAGVVIPAKNLGFGESDIGSGTFDHIIQADD